MKRLLLSSCMVLGGLLQAASGVQTHAVLIKTVTPQRDLFSEIAATQTSSNVFTRKSSTNVPLTQESSMRASILQTDIVPYIQSENTETQYQSSQEQLAVVEQELAVTQEELVTTQESLQTTQSQLVVTQDELTQAESEIQSLIDSCSSSDPGCASELESTQALLSASDSIIDQATDLINDPTIPDASAIDAMISDLFGYTPTFIDSLATDPLVPRIQDGLLPYLQAALEKLGDYSKIVKISAGAYHLVVLTQGGRVYGTGYNGHGQLGLGNDEYPSILTPMIGEGASGVTDIAAGYNHTVILKGDKAYATGWNDFGQLGIGTSDYEKLSLTEMVGEGMSGVTAIAAGESHTLVLKDDKVFGAGESWNGQLGLGRQQQEVLTLTAMTGEGSSGVAKISAGGFHSLILKSGTGAVYGCGAADSGQLGIGYNPPGNIMVTPALMIGEGASNVDTIATGENYSFILKNGKAYATGANAGGVLGIGTFASTSTLTEVVGEGLSGVTAVACGNNDNAYLLKGDKAYSVGANDYGQLGIGTISGDPIHTFTAMIGEGLSGVTAITAGQRFAAVLKDYKSYGTGYNRDAELGIGTYEHVNVLTKSQRQL